MSSPPPPADYENYDSVYLDLFPWRVTLMRLTLTIAGVTAACALIGGLLYGCWQVWSGSWKEKSDPRQRLRFLVVPWPLWRLWDRWLNPIVSVYSWVSLVMFVVSVAKGPSPGIFRSPPPPWPPAPPPAPPSVPQPPQPPPPPSPSPNPPPPLGCSCLPSYVLNGTTYNGATYTDPYTYDNVSMCLVSQSCNSSFTTNSGHRYVMCDMPPPPPWPPFSATPAPWTNLNASTALRIAVIFMCVLNLLGNVWALIAFYHYQMGVPAKQEEAGGDQASDNSWSSPAVFPRMLVLILSWVILLPFLGDVFVVVWPYIYYYEYEYDAAAGKLCPSSKFYPYWATYGARSNLWGLLTSSLVTVIQVLLYLRGFGSDFTVVQSLALQWLGLSTYLATTSTRLVLAIAGHDEWYWVFPPQHEESTCRWPCAWPATAFTTFAYIVMWLLGFVATLWWKFDVLGSYYYVLGGATLVVIVVGELLGRIGERAPSNQVFPLPAGSNGLDVAASGAAPTMLTVLGAPGTGHMFSTPGTYTFVRYDPVTNTSVYSLAPYAV